jgi:hypothetical protein
MDLSFSRRSLREHCHITSSLDMVLAIGLRIYSLGLTDNSGPVHTLQEEVTPEVLAAVEQKHQTESQVRKGSQDRSHGIHFPRQKSSVTQ